MCALVTGVQTCALPISWRDGGVREARFCLGAADGFTPEERAGADKVIAFGRATWPHLMARAMLAEQLWRATSILAGHPYHREGRKRGVPLLRWRASTASREAGCGWRQSSTTTHSARYVGEWGGRRGWN